MKLDEVSLDKAEMMASMLGKLLDRGVKVMLHTTDFSGKPMYGVLNSLHHLVLSQRWTMTYFEIDKGKTSSRMDSTSVTYWEFEHSTLKKQPDGSYIFNLPHEEAQ